MLCRRGRTQIFFSLLLHFLMTSFSFQNTATWWFNDDIPIIESSTETPMGLLTINDFFSYLTNIYTIARVIILFNVYIYPIPILCKLQVKANET
ncbi:hypothetical protein BJX76DRAFT_292282 [Aspergillus varians]